MLTAVEKEIILAFIRQNPRKLADFLEREDAETFLNEPQKSRHFKPHLR
jgi:hypothetical protein